MKTKKSFTLVELVIAIIIISIVSFTAFYAITDRLLTSRDSQRMIDLKAIEFSLKNYYYENKNFPTPSDSVSLLKLSAMGTWYIWYQWYLGLNNIRDLKLKWKFQDPLDRNYYLFSVNYLQDKYQLLVFMEWIKYNLVMSYLGDRVNAIDDKVAVDYLKRFPSVEGNSLWILLTKDKKIPLNFVYSGEFDLSATPVELIAYLSSNQTVSGTGSVLQILYQTMKNGYQPPTWCPSGFIPVPWNKDFKQSGFCVAKYEMKQYSGDAGSWNGVGWVALTWTSNWPYCSLSTSCVATAARNFTGAIVSKAWGYPIVYINQYNAMKACESLWTGFHLITNNERMSIARNIESNNQNWWTGKYMSFAAINTDYRGINQWESKQNLFDGSWGALSATNDYWLSGNVQLKIFDNKRTHILSNSEIIWDFAGNVAEHVNGWNTLNWSNYTITWNICWWAWAYSFFKDAIDTATQCGFINGYTYANIWPKKTNLNATNGIGWITSSAVTNNILLRGWSWVKTTKAWIYNINATNINTYVSADVWFRCAY